MPRATDWIDTLVNTTVATGAQSRTDLVSGIGAIDLRGATVIRTLLSLSFMSSSIAGAYGGQRIDLGILIASREAEAAGVVPDPGVAGDHPPRGWLYRTSRVVAQNGSGMDPLLHVSADIRAARKVEQGKVILVIDNEAVSGTSFTYHVDGLIRLLIKLP